MNRQKNASVHISLMRIGLGLLLILLWETLGRTYGSRWTSLPSQIALKAYAVGVGFIAYHTAVTLIEVLLGFLIGGGVGVAFGVLFGRVSVVADVFSTLITILYTIPMVALVPLLIMWFGLDMAPKLILVSVVVFFLMFFNVFTGARLVDDDILDGVRLMGAARFEQFLKVELPSVQTWIFAGARIAVPYALVAATTAEIMASRAGLGFIVAQASSRLDMASLYMALFILMLSGLLCTQAVRLAETKALAWRKGPV